MKSWKTNESKTLGRHILMLLQTWKGNLKELSNKVSHFVLNEEIFSFSVKN